jgi:hypothetical protein
MNNRKIKTIPLPEQVAVVEVGKFAKISLIRKFQRIEGNIDCCASAYTRVCKQIECLWRDECLEMTQEPVRS